MQEREAIDAADDAGAPPIALLGEFCDPPLPEIQQVPCADGFVRSFIETANLIVATGNNYAAMCMSVRDAAREMIRPGQEVSEGLLNMVEMAFRAYDPCMACATHSLPGQMPMRVLVRDKDGRILKTLARHID